ncbi:MAG TPA: SIMPL domain-containing protein [Pyrinomonadaceae bacterium]|nr:SIMPL domain-containing protein [Pyrinomonadaceae bacterium]
MKKASFFVILLFASTMFAQTPTTDSRRVIEVTGSAETFVTPNEFTFKITIVERVDGKKKITIEDQEEALKRELAAIGVDVQKDLTIYDLTSVYVRQRRLKDTLGSKDYRLKIYDINKIGRLQDLADKLNLSKLDLIDSTHTELAKFRKETKIEALKAAKTKADYLLAAIGERSGKPVFVREVEENDNSSYRPNIYANVNVTSNIVRGGDNQSTDDSLNITQIKLRYEVFARFEIE